MMRPVPIVSQGSPMGSGAPASLVLQAAPGLDSAPTQLRQHHPCFAAATNKAASSQATLLLERKLPRFLRTAPKLTMPLTPARTFLRRGPPVSRGLLRVQHALPLSRLCRKGRLVPLTITSGRAASGMKRKETAMHRFHVGSRSFGGTKRESGRQQVICISMLLVACRLRKKSDRFKTLWGYCEDAGSLVGSAGFRACAPVGH